MVKLEEITTTPTFSDQLDNKVLFARHTDDISISYRSTYTLKYVIAGVKRYNYNHQDIEVSKGQYLILDNNSKITTEAKRGTKGLSFFLSQNLVSEIYSYHEVTNTSAKFLDVVQRQPTDEVGFLLQKMAYLHEQDPMAFRFQLDHLFILISELLVREQVGIDSKFKALKIVKHATKNELFRLITQAKEYLNDHVDEHITLDIISREIGVSKYYLHRLFTEVVGYSPLKYLTRIRLQKARHSLQFSNDSIFTIAVACGFGDSAYFSNTFKKYIGLSPSQFRKGL